MAKVIPAIGLTLALSLVGCGGTGRTDATARPPPTAKVQFSTCGAKAGFGFRLHGVDCEIANTLIVMLDGRALHQSVTVTAEGKRQGKWVCISPTHSLEDRLHCQEGARYFTVERASR